MFILMYSGKKSEQPSEDVLFVQFFYHREFQLEPRSKFDLLTKKHFWYYKEDGYSGGLINYSIYKIYFLYRR